MTGTLIYKQEGFTLIQLIICLVIIAVVTALSFPAWRPIIEKSKHQAAAYRIYRFFQFARSSAVYQRHTLTACASRDRISCIVSNDWSQSDLILFIDHNQNGERDTDESVIRHLSLASLEAQLQWRSFGNKHYLQWQSNGMSYYQNGNFLYCPKDKNPRHAFMLIVNAAGRMYFANDRDADGIVEDSEGRNIQCL